jgi:hypothetical protein
MKLESRSFVASIFGGIESPICPFPRPDLHLATLKGRCTRNRFVMLPRETEPALIRQMDWRSALHAKDVARGEGRVYMPAALERKFPNADRELSWQYVFASTRISQDPRVPLTPALSAEVGERERRGRHHIHESAVQRAVPPRFASSAGRSAPPAALSDILLPLTCSKWARTSELCRSFSATTMCGRR